MSNIMQVCLHQQPQAMRSILAHEGETIPPFVALYADKPVARVVLVGAGSSYHALNMARPLCQAAMGVPVFAATPVQLDWLDDKYAEDTLVIAASQSGTSSNTLAKIQALRKMGYLVTAITQVPDSLIAKAVDHHVLLAMPEEKAGPKTMGVLGTMLTLQKMLVALSVRKGGNFDQQGFDRDVETITENLQANIDLTVKWCESVQDDLAKSHAYCVVAQGENATIAGEGALKLVETVRVAVTPYELDEIIHGPLLMFPSKPTMLYLGTPWEEQKRPDALRRICQALGGQVYLVTLTQDEPGFDAGTLTLKTAGNPLLAAYELLLALQVISAYVPQVMGIDLEDPNRHHPLEKELAGHL